MNQIITSPRFFDMLLSSHIQSFIHHACIPETSMFHAPYVNYFINSPSVLSSDIRFPSGPSRARGGLSLQ